LGAFLSLAFLLLLPLKLGVCLEELVFTFRLHLT
jgi:hypothetical protein